MKQPLLFIVFFCLSRFLFFPYGSTFALGCTVGSVKSSGGSNADQGCVSGAYGGVIGEILSEGFFPYLTDFSADTKLALAQTTTIFSSSALGYDFNLANEAAVNAISNNYLLHEEELLLKEARARCAADPNNVKACQTEFELTQLDKKRDKEYKAIYEKECKEDHTSRCPGIAEHLAQTNGFGYLVFMKEARGNPNAFNNCLPTDPGGCSYSIVQLAANVGGVEALLDYLENKNNSKEAKYMLKKLKEAGGVEGARDNPDVFRAALKELNDADPQYVQYIIESQKKGNWKTLADKLQEQIGIDINTLSSREKEMLFSGVVQHGGHGFRRIMKKAFWRSAGDEKELFLADYPGEEDVYDNVQDIKDYEDAKYLQRKLERNQLKLKDKQLKLERSKGDLERSKGDLKDEQKLLERSKNKLYEKLLESPTDQKIKEIKKQIKAIDGTIQRKDDAIKRKDDAIKIKDDAIQRNDDTIKKQGSKILELEKKKKKLFDKLGGYFDENGKAKEYLTGRDLDVYNLATYGYMNKPSDRQKMRSQFEGMKIDGRIEFLYNSRISSYPAFTKRYTKEKNILLTQKDRFNYSSSVEQKVSGIPLSQENPPLFDQERYLQSLEKINKPTINFEEQLKEKKAKKSRDFEEPSFLDKLYDEYYRATQEMLYYFVPPEYHQYYK